MESLAVVRAVQRISSEMSREPGDCIVSPGLSFTRCFDPLRVSRIIPCMLQLATPYEQALLSA